MNDTVSKFNDSSQVNLGDLFGFIYKGKKIISILTIIFSIAAITYSLFLPNIYRSETLLAPIDNKGSGLGSALEGVGSLASLAGFSLPDGQSASKSKEAIEILQSYTFFRENIYPNIYLPDLMAYKSWNPKENINKYDESLFDTKNNEWVRKVSFPQKVKPSSQEAYEIFKNHFFINEDIDTRFVEIAITHKSPNIARYWLVLLISQINSELRNNEKEIATRSVNYIKDQIAQTKVSEVKMALSQLAQNETQKLMLIESREDYVYKILERPFAPELKFSPSRSLICILGFLLGFSLGVFVQLIRYFFDNNRD